MRAMVLEKIKTPLKLADIPIPIPGPDEVLIKILACAVCRTDLHIYDGELTNAKLPLVLGHQIVGEIVELGEKVTNHAVGTRVGVPWVGFCCGHCPFCRAGRENLCDNIQYTGYQRDGGFAEYCVANAKFVFILPKTYSPVEAAPLLCGGLIGYRALRFCGEAKQLGLYGFGSAAHMILQVARYQDRKVYAFTRPGDKKAQDFAKELGASWAGSSEEASPELLDAAIIFASVGALVPKALAELQKGGSIVCAGIHMSDIPSFSYSLLWEERLIRSVANLTRRDGEEFLDLAFKIPIKAQVTVYPLEKVNDALNDLRQGNLIGTAVIAI